MYNYETEKSKIFTEDGMKKFVVARDKILNAIHKTGAITMGHAISMCGAGDSWCHMAMVDHMVILGDIREINYGPCAGQHRVFVRF